MAYFLSHLPIKRLTPKKNYNTFETLVIQSRLMADMIILLLEYIDHQNNYVAIDYYIRVEEDLNDIQTQLLMVTGDLDLNCLNPESKEGNILTDLEDIHSLLCLIDTPTKVTESSQTLLDIILTNKPELFKEHDILTLASVITRWFMVF